ncbi:hypothetical protein [Sphingomonas psychrolutea]|uniref:UrcA family protein n=1 Tax=Sphingomonas psychrolutea TaxID=1259676 RepID=A0ABQ1H9F9_9SPHN|nr:hypothetical protein [Sphingomonas psychrolutea]GGA62368.1 hypothetical protein GCM10011395_35720 [Sphingomonas psychrolutea]
MQAQIISLFLSAIVIGSPIEPPTAIETDLPQIQTVDTTNFVFRASHIRAKGDGFRIESSLCRKPNRSVMSASRAQIEQLSANGDVISTIYAYLPRVSQREDQRCSSFAAMLKRNDQPTVQVRVCLAQRGKPCRMSR